MSTARLSAELLAPKGHALPLDSVYEHPMQIPGDGAVRHQLVRPPISQPPAGKTAALDGARLSCRLQATVCRDLKILAARRQCSVQTLMREALSTYLNSNRSGCDCMKGGDCQRIGNC